MGQASLVLCLQDTTELDFNGQIIDGLGPLSYEVSTRSKRCAAQVAAWQASRDQINAKINWQFTSDRARIKLKRRYPTFKTCRDTS